MDLRTREVTRDGRGIELTRTEFSLLEMFLRHPRQVLAREQLLSSIWGFDFGPTSNSLDVYVMYLRRKTEAGGESPAAAHRARRRLRPAGGRGRRAGRAREGDGGAAGRGEGRDAARGAPARPVRRRPTLLG